MNISNRELGEDLRLVYERVFYHVARKFLTVDVMEHLIMHTISLINSSGDVQEVLQRIDSDIEDIVNETSLEGFTDEL